jgi:hypothetical protein
MHGKEDEIYYTIGTRIVKFHQAPELLNSIKYSMRKATCKFEKSFSHVSVSLPTLLQNCTDRMGKPQNKN